jgi:hypothetical protein
VSMVILLVLIAADERQPHRPAAEPGLVPGACRPECPWCDTHECTDIKLCNCTAPCSSWLCVIKEASSG